VNNLKIPEVKYHQMLAIRLASTITAKASARHTVCVANSVAKSRGTPDRIFFPSADAEAGLRIRILN